MAKPIKTLKTFNRSSPRKPAKGTLFIAAATGNAGAVRDLLARGADKEERNAEGLTPLMAAAHRGHEDCLRLLIEAGADSNVKDPGGDTALVMAADEDRAACARLLVENGAKIDEKRANGMTPLSTSVWHGHVETALLLIEKGADVNAKAENGDPALVFAAADAPPERRGFRACHQGRGHQRHRPRRGDPADLRRLGRQYGACAVPGHERR